MSLMDVLRPAHVPTPKGAKRVSPLGCDAPETDAERKDRERREAAYSRLRKWRALHPGAATALNRKSRA